LSKVTFPYSPLSQGISLSLFSLSLLITSLPTSLLSSGDLGRYPEDISNVFVKCFCQLTLQASVIATLLSLISRSNREFPELVLQKLLTQFMSSLKSGDILVTRNLFRVLSCLASTNTLSLEGEEEQGVIDGTASSPSIGFIQLLQLLCSIAESETLSSSQYSIQTEAAIFLLASSAPYYAHLLHRTGHEQTSSRISAICRAVAPLEENPSGIFRMSSQYDVGGSHAVFHVSIEGTIPPLCANDSTSIYTPQRVSPVGAVCWDSLWEVSHHSYSFPSLSFLRPVVLLITS
jgi:hypothetical protein